MPRTRLLHPDAPHDEVVAALSMAARLVWAYLPCHADREGRLVDKPFAIKIAILPTDDVDMVEILAELATAGLIYRYVVEGRKYIQVRNFKKYQRPHHHEAASEIPEAPRCVGLPLVDQGSPLVDQGSPLVDQGSPLVVNVRLDPVSDPVSDPVRREREDPPSGALVLFGDVVPEEGPGKPRTTYPPVFERCWKLYGRKEEKAKAYALGWKHAARLVGADCELERLVTAALQWQGPIWAKDGWQYAPYFERYLRNRKWEDQPAAGKGAGLDLAAVIAQQRGGR